MEKMKNIFKSVSSRNGSYSVGLIALAICIAVMVNLIVGKLPESVTKIDISDNKIYEISDVSKEMLGGLEKDVKFTVYAEKASVDDHIKTFIDKYTALSDKITVEWVDPVLYPAELSENNVSENTILISCANTGKSKAVTFDQILVVDEYSYYMTGSSDASEFDGEGQFTSAVNYVVSGETKRIYCTTGHGENTFSSSVTELLNKNNITADEVNLLMENEIPDDCDLLYLYAPASDITEDEKNLILDYMSEGGKVFVMLGQMNGDAPNLDALLAEYGMERADGYIADMQRCYQGNYYYIFPEIAGSSELSDGLSSGMVLLVDAHGLNLTDAARDTVTVEEFMSTSSDGYAVTEDSQEQGNYTLGAVATESESRLTVISADSMIDSQITDAFATLENLDLFMNTISANFEDVENIAIEAKSLTVTYNTMQHAGLFSILVIFVIPLIVVIYGFVSWWKRRKA